MTGAVSKSYEQYREEDRLTTNNARRIEFLTTTRALDALVPGRARVLDCAAGTGVYAMYFAQKGHDVTALDLTPRHIDVLRGALEGKPYTMETGVNDATDLSRFEDDSFDVVLCMGPYYHLTRAADRSRCIAECARVLRPGGLLAVAYISRFYILTHVTLHAPRYMTQSFVDKVLESGVLTADDPESFWTDTYFATPSEMNALVGGPSFEPADHFAADGLSPQLHTYVDALDAEAFAIWCEAHYRMCREPSLLGGSNHGMVIGRKL